MTHSLIPHLIVPDTAAAIAFYVDAFGAREIERFTDAKIARIVHARIEIGGAPLTLADEARDWHNHAPRSLGGSPVVLHLEVDDPDATAERAVAGGARVVFPIADQFYGRREGRIEDPFGHLWILSRATETLSADEIQRRVDAFPSR